VLPLVVSGLLNKHPAELGISEVMLQIHRRMLMQKMLRFARDLVRMAEKLQFRSPILAAGEGRP